MDLCSGFGVGTRFVRRTAKRISVRLAPTVSTGVGAFAKRLVGSFNRDHLFMLLLEAGRERRLKEMADARGLVRRVCGLCGDKPIVIVVILNALRFIACSKQRKEVRCS